MRKQFRYTCEKQNLSLDNLKDFLSLAPKKKMLVMKVQILDQYAHAKSLLTQTHLS